MDFVRLSLLSYSYAVLMDVPSVSLVPRSSTFTVLSALSFVTTLLEVVFTLTPSCHISLGSITISLVVLLSPEESITSYWYSYSVASGSVTDSRFPSYSIFSPICNAINSPSKATSITVSSFSILRKIFI